MLLLFAVAIGVALLLHYGICPMTIQLLVIGVVMWGLATASPAPPEHFYNGGHAESSSKTLVPPQDAALTNCIETIDGSYDKVMTITDRASGSTFTCTTPNAKSNALLLVKGDPWTGGQSSGCGVFNDFTVAATIKMDPTTEVTLLKVDGQENKVQTKVEVSVHTGPEGKRAVKLTYGSATFEASVSATAEPVTIIVCRKGTQVTIRQSVHSVTASSDVGQGDLQDVKVTPNSLLPIEVGDLKVGSAELTRILVWNVALSNGDIETVANQGLSTQLLNEPTYKDLVNKLDRAVKDGKSSHTKNPYGDQGVQTACEASVPNWQVPNALANAAPQCWDAVNNYCTKNPTTKGCECWGASKDTVACKKFMATLNSSPYIDIGNLQDGDINKIMQQYGLVKGGQQTVCKTAATQQKNSSLDAEEDALMQKASSRSFLSWLFGRF